MIRYSSVQIEIIWVVLILESGLFLLQTLQVFEILQFFLEFLLFFLQFGLLLIQLHLLLDLLHFLLNLLLLIKQQLSILLSLGLGMGLLRNGVLEWLLVLNLIGLRLLNAILARKFL